MAPSLNINSHVLTLYRTEIGSGTIINQIYYIGTPMILALPLIITNPAGIATSIDWAASPFPIWLSLDGVKIIINS